MKQIIVNADDFGINQSVTAEIERQILLGNVSSTTIMANGACLDEVKRFANEHPEASYGIHLCLSEFDSITKSENLYRAGLTDENGRFIHKAIFRLNNYETPIIQSAIKDELNAQIDVVSELGFPISHADSHHHVHTIYPLRELFADVIQKRGITKIRLGEDFRTWRSKRHLLLWMNQVKLNKFYSNNFKTTDAFYSYMEYVRIGQKNREKTIELMCHPGHPGINYQKEMEFITAKYLLNNKEIQLITYNDIR